MLNRIHDRGGYIGLPNSQSTTVYDNPEDTLSTPTSSTSGYSPTVMSADVVMCADITNWQSTDYGVIVKIGGSVYGMAVTALGDGNIRASAFDGSAWQSTGMVYTSFNMSAYNGQSGTLYLVGYYSTDTIEVYWKQGGGSDTTTAAVLLASSTISNSTTYIHGTDAFAFGELIQSIADHNHSYSQTNYSGTITGGRLWEYATVPSPFQGSTTTTVLDVEPSLGSTTDYNNGVVGDPLYNDYKILSHLDGASFSDEFGHTMTAYASAALSSTQSKFGGVSAYFPAGDSRVVISPSQSGDFDVGSSDFTCECWVYFNSFTTTADTGFFRLVEPGTSYGAFGVTKTATNSWRFLYSTSGTAWAGLSASGTITTGQWYHVAVVRNGSSLTLYINGVSTVSYSISTTALTNVATQMNLGWTEWAADDRFDGYIDEFRFVVGSAAYTTNFTPPTAPFNPIPPIPATLQSSGVWSLDAVYDYLNVIDFTGVTVHAQVWGGSEGSGSSSTLTIPSTVEDGDLAFFFSNVDRDTPFSTPTGWTSVADTTASGSEFPDSQLFAKLLTTSDANTTVTTTHSYDARSYGLIVFRFTGKVPTAFTAYDAYGMAGISAYSDTLGSSAGTGTVLCIATNGGRIGTYDQSPTLTMSPSDAILTHDGTGVSFTGNTKLGYKLFLAGDTKTDISTATTDNGRQHLMNVYLEIT